MSGLTSHDNVKATCWFQSDTSCVAAGDMCKWFITYMSGPYNAAYVCLWGQSQ